jgi:hypothetical protein
MSWLCCVLLLLLLLPAAGCCRVTPPPPDAQSLREPSVALGVIEVQLLGLVGLLMQHMHGDKPSLGCLKQIVQPCVLTCT